jgi:hypothetical protein
LIWVKELESSQNTVATMRYDSLTIAGYAVIIVTALVAVSMFM